MADTHHLQLRNTRWYYHRRVPLECQGRFGLVIKQSLGTSVKKEAIRLREIRDIEWSARFASSVDEGRENGRSFSAAEAVTRKLGRLSGPLAIELVREYVARTDARYRAAWEANPPKGRARQEAIENAELDLAVASDRAPSYDHDGYVFEEMHALASAAGADCGKGPEADAFFHLVKRALTEVFRRALARAHDDHGAAFFDHLFDPEAKRAVAVGDLIVQFVSLQNEEAAARKLSEKHIEKIKAQAETVALLLGRETIVQAIDHDRCLAARSLLARLPPNRLKQYRDMRLDEVVRCAEAEKEPRRLSFITQQQYLGCLKQVLDLAVSKGLLRTNPANTLAPLAFDEVSAEDKRPPFTAEQLVAFFHSPYYTRCAASGPVPYKGADKDWRFWLPLICLFMGMRPKEVCQLHVDDLRRTEKGTWYLCVEATSDRSGPTRKTTKTKASRRDVPLHGELVRMGFVQFVEEAKASSGDPRLFRTITRNRYGDPAQYPLRRFNEVYLPGTLTMTARQSFYSFRHTWRDAVRAVDPPADFLKAVGAWGENRTTSDIYGSLNHPERYAPWMNKVRYEGLDLSHLHLSH